MVSSSLHVLTADEVARFVRDGYLVVREVFSRTTAAQLADEVWSRLPERPDDPTTWTRAHVQIEDVIRSGPLDGLFTPRFCGSVNDLVGIDSWTTTRGFGWVIMRFPGFRHKPWRAPDSGWHVDGIDHVHHLTSPETGLVGIEMLTDTAIGGGGTTVRVGSHLVIARHLHAAEPTGLSYAQLRDVSESLTDLPAVEVTGSAGDVLWMHPFLVHARGPNTSDRVRMAANRCISLKQPMLIERIGPTPVELAIATALATHHGISRPE